MAALLVLAAGAFPVGMMRPAIEMAISRSHGGKAHIGSIERERWFSLAPVLIVRDIRIAQPAWAGSGDLLRADRLIFKLPLWPVLLGRPLRPTGLVADGLALALVRDADGRANWASGSAKGGERTSGGMVQVRIRDGRFTLRDVKRSLDLRGTINADSGAGLRIESQGRFHDASATLVVHGAPIAGTATDAPYAFTLALRSRLLDLNIRGQSRGALNTDAMSLAIDARAPSLKYLDDVIEAGLFGTQPIDLQARVRKQGRDWFIDALAGRIGRSSLHGRGSVLKRGGRSKVDARIRFSELDFGDLADDAGKARARAREGRIGPRVLPDTRINLAKVGPTDGVVHFATDRLLTEGGSVFRSLSGDIRLDHKHLVLDRIVAGMASGRMTGRLDIRQQGSTARLDADLRFEDGRLTDLLGETERIDGPYRAHVRLTGTGDTIREALSAADGTVGLFAQKGTVSRLAAAVLGQDLGKTIGAALDDRSARVRLHCAAIGFAARDGILRVRDFQIETAISAAQGVGGINLKTEKMALIIGGRAREGSGLPIVDPVRIAGTLSDPALEIAGAKDGKLGLGGTIAAIRKSFGAALGLTEKQGPAVPTAQVDCAALGARVLGGDQSW